MSNGEDNKFQELDLKIAKALQIDVPPLVMPELPEIDDTNVTILPVRRRSTRPLWFAVAASVVLASSIALRMSGVFTTDGSLTGEVLAHLDHEPGALQVTDIAVSDEQLARAVPARLATFSRGDALVTYAMPCKINGRTAPHLVIQGQHGPITILLMPEEKVAVAMPFDGDNVHGVIIPAGDGSIAIVGPREEALESIRADMLESVTWTT
jgi:hypothetical protein